MTWWRKREYITGTFLPGRRIRAEFNPDLSMSLAIEGNTYEFLPHPLFPAKVNQFPRKSTAIYQLRRRTDRTLWALKVTDHDHRGPHIERITAALMRYQYLPGLAVTHRSCLTKAKHPELISAYPGLEYAILMPWIAGATWAGLMGDPVASASYTLAHARKLATTTAHILWSLEAHHLVHTDIAGDNVIVLNCKQVELIDIEGLYRDDGPRLSRWQEEAQASIERLLRKSELTEPTKGWQGYRHPHLDERGQRRPDGDRFAGAILLAEMLTWWNPLVRAMTDDRYESLFQFNEKEPPEVLRRRLQVIRKTLCDIRPCLLKLFDQAWGSPDVSACPPLQEWALCLLRAQR